LFVSFLVVDSVNELAIAALPLAVQRLVAHRAPTLGATSRCGQRWTDQRATDMPVTRQRPTAADLHRHISGVMDCHDCASDEAATRLGSEQPAFTNFDFYFHLLLTPCLLFAWSVSSVRGDHSAQTNEHRKLLVRFDFPHPRIYFCSTFSVSLQCAANAAGCSGFASNMSLLKARCLRATK
jgi:hypothetical protein